MPLSPAIDTSGGIQLNSLLFNRVDENGLYWIVEDIDGWWNLPEASVPDAPSGLFTDGSIYVSGRFQSRTMTMSGFVVLPDSSPDLTLLAAAQRRIHRELDTARGSALLRVDEYDASKQAVVQIASRPRTSFDHPNNMLMFSVELRAVDPRKYAATQTSLSTSVYVSAGGRAYSRTYPRTYPSMGSSGTIDAVNVGSTSTTGTIRIQGPVISPQIDHLESGSFLSLNITLSSTDYIDLDLSTKTVTLNGQVNRRNALRSTSKWFVLQPGQNTIRFTKGPTGSTAGTATLTYRSAWLE